MALPQIDSLRTAEAPKGRHAASHAAARAPRVNLVLLLIIIVLVSYGLLVCWSAIESSGDSSYSFTRQLMFAAVGAIIMLLMWNIDYSRFANMVMPLFIINLALILCPHIPGLGTDAGMGAQSWIRIGIQVQPGELAKVTIILMDAAIMARYGGRLDDVREYCKAAALMVVPFLAIMTQPDLGTGLVYLAIAAMALFAGGAKGKYLLVTLAAVVAAVAAVFAIDQVIYNATGEYKLLKQYQRNRLLVFLDQSGNASTDQGYNLQQAKVAIGSGGFFGKGLLNATQSGYGYVPESETDFIFCVLAEQFGFVGSLALLALYAALIWQSVRIARRASDLFGTLIVMCVVGMWLFQVLENIGMDCGLMPITGIPLPFVSYGSTGMVMSFMALGLIGSVWHFSGVSKKKEGKV